MLHCPAESVTGKREAGHKGYRGVQETREEVKRGGKQLQKEKVEVGATRNRGEGDRQVVIVVPEEGRGYGDH